jgi:hypothetical protein
MTLSLRLNALQSRRTITVGCIQMALQPSQGLGRACAESGSGIDKTLGRFLLRIHVAL